MIAALKEKSIQHHQHTTELSGLEIVRNSNVNIAIYERTLSRELMVFLEELIQKGFKPLNAFTNVDDIENLLDHHFEEHNQTNEGYRLLKEDIIELIGQFSAICNNPSFKIFFGIVDTDMCRRFHVDMYELRMLCTYEGQGTMWLTDDNINYSSLQNLEGNEKIVLRNKDIMQIETNDVAIIKGALYPNSSIGGLVHRSPTIENLNQKRIVLRVDTNSLLDSLTK